MRTSPLYSYLEILNLIRDSTSTNELTVLSYVLKEDRCHYTIKQLEVLTLYLKTKGSLIFMTKLKV